MQGVYISPQMKTANQNEISEMMLVGSITQQGSPSRTKQQDYFTMRMNSVAVMSGEQNQTQPLIPYKPKLKPGMTLPEQDPNQTSPDIRAIRVKKATSSVSSISRDESHDGSPAILRHQTSETSIIKS